MFSRFLTTRLKIQQSREQEKLQQELKILQGSQNGLKKRQDPNKGRGVFAEKLFPKGSYVTTYEGNRISFKEAKILEEKYAKIKNHNCYMYFYEHRGKKNLIIFKHNNYT